MEGLIERLKNYERDNLDSWYELSGKQTKKFLKQIVQFSTDNPNDIRNYCVNTLPSEFSSLSIVYEALSEYSMDFNEFLLDEIKRCLLYTSDAADD